MFQHPLFWVEAGLKRRPQQPESPNVSSRNSSLASILSHSCDENRTRKSHYINIAQSSFFFFTRKSQSTEASIEVEAIWNGICGDKAAAAARFLRKVKPSSSLREINLIRQWDVDTKKWNEPSVEAKACERRFIEKENQTRAPPSSLPIRPLQVWWVMISNFKVKTTKRFYCWIIVNFCILSKCELQYSERRNFPCCRVTSRHLSFMFDWIILSFILVSLSPSLWGASEHVCWGEDLWLYGMS